MTGRCICRVSHGLVWMIAMAAISCASAAPPKPHATTKATPKSRTAAPVVLPPASDTYTVIGTGGGLNGFVVKYDDSFYRGIDVKQIVELALTEDIRGTIVEIEDHRKGEKIAVAIE